MFKQSGLIEAAIIYQHECNDEQHCRFLVDTTEGVYQVKKKPFPLNHKKQSRRKEKHRRKIIDIMSSGVKHNRKTKYCHHWYYVCQCERGLIQCRIQTTDNKHGPEQ